MPRAGAAPASPGAGRSAKPDAGHALAEQQAEPGHGAPPIGVCTAVVRRPVGYTPRRDAGLTRYERVLVRAGLGPVVGIDEAGRGACAGPLVVAAVALDRWSGDASTALADSKALTARAREAAYERIVKSARAWHVVVISSADIDRHGLHVCNVAGMRRALAGISCRPGYVLTDGFPVSGLPVPALAMWKGDQVAACVAAASVVAKVTRDRIMTGLHDRYPGYDFAEHKGYATPRHAQALADHGPCEEHRFSYVNVLGAMRARGTCAPPMPDNGEMADVARAVNGARIAAAPPGGDAAVRNGTAARSDAVVWGGAVGDEAGAVWSEEGSMDFGAS